MTGLTKNNSCTVAMMLAMDKNKLIGKEGGMPWHIPGEMAYFKSVTMGKPVVMGRKTFDSIGKPLPGRPNLVVTRNAEWSADGVQAYTTLDLAIAGAVEYYALQASNSDISTNAQNTAEHATEPPEVMIIGGAGLCREAMPVTQRIYLTHIDHAYEGDIWFDSFEWDDWQIVSRKDNELDGLKFTYFVLERAA